MIIDWATLCEWNLTLNLTLTLILNLVTLTQNLTILVWVLQRTASAISKYVRIIPVGHLYVALSVGEAISIFPDDVVQLPYVSYVITNYQTRFRVSARRFRLNGDPRFGAGLIKNGDHLI